MPCLQIWYVRLEVRQGSSNIAFLKMARVVPRPDVKLQAPALCPSTFPNIRTFIWLPSLPHTDGKPCSNVNVSHYLRELSAFTQGLFDCYPTLQRFERPTLECFPYPSTLWRARPMRAPFLAFVRGADGSARLEICRYSGCFDPKLCDVYQVSTLMLCQSFFCRFLERWSRRIGGGEDG